MKKYLLYTIVWMALSCSASFAQGNHIPWKFGTNLSWNDFQGRPDAASSFAAYTATSTTYNYKWSSDGTMSTTVACVFKKEDSWKKPEKPLTPALLKHEQIHFDIAELYTRKIRQAFSNYIASHKHTDATKDELEKIFRKLIDESKTVNNQYDEETNHSQQTEKQEEWNHRIASMLGELSAYASQ